MTEGFPRWVDQEIWNWARSQWDGEWPGPGRPDSDPPAVCEYPPQAGHDESDEPVRFSINQFRADKVNRIYEALPLEERRVVQAEYTRRKEYGELPAHLRHEAACRRIGIPLPYYKIALGSFKQQVMRDLV